MTYEHIDDIQQYGDAAFEEARHNTGGPQVAPDLDTVAPQMVCPKCGENRVDWLRTDGDDVECDSCGCRYSLIFDDIPFDGSIPQSAHHEHATSTADSRDAAG